MVLKPVCAAADFIAILVAFVTTSPGPHRSYTRPEEKAFYCVILISMVATPAASLVWNVEKTK